MKIYGHIALVDAETENGTKVETLCGRTRKLHRKPVLVVCGKCARLTMEHANQSHRATTTWSMTITPLAG